jgi:hypothetical protein
MVCSPGTACKVGATMSVLAGVHSCRIGRLRASTCQSVAVSLLMTFCCVKGLVTANCDVVTSGVRAAHVVVGMNGLDAGVWQLEPSAQAFIIQHGGLWCGGSSLLLLHVRVSSWKLLLFVSLWLRVGEHA